MSMSTSFQHKTMALLCATFLLCACAGGTKVTRVQHLDPAADAPYQKFLVIALLSSYDARRYLEKEIVTQLTELGTDAVASTTMMDTRTPVTRETFIAMVEKIGADGVIISQMVHIESTSKLKDARPQATYNFRPTYYYNVWSVDLTEYVKPPGLEIATELVMATQVFSVARMESVWTMEAEFEIVQDIDQAWSYSVFPNQAKEISRLMSRDGLILN